MNSKTFNTKSPYNRQSVSWSGTGCGRPRVERATEDTYVAEFVSVIKEIGKPIGFDAEFNKTTPSGKADINLIYRGTLVAVVEVKEPGIPLSDPDLKVQAERYATWYHKNRSVHFYGIHNLKYLSIFKYVASEKRDKTLLEYMGTKKSDWASVTDFPFRIMPWIRSINDFKQISTNNNARKNLEEFLLKFKEMLEGKSLDLSTEVIDIVRRYIEEGASHGLTQFENLYKSGEKNVRTLFEDWRKERGIEDPRNDDKLRNYLTLMIKEQLYTLSMKVLFYHVLQNIDLDMAAKLKENLAAIEPSDPELFQRIFDMLFKYAIEKTGDFEEVFGTNTVDRLPLVEQTLQSLVHLISYLNQIRWSDINVDVIGRVFERLIYTERRHMLGQHYTETNVVDLILAATLRKPGKLIDPSCGSGTFPVRALNFWKTNYTTDFRNFELVEGIDIDKLASMLSKINLYIQALEAIEGKLKFNPKIFHRDFFKTELLQDYLYVVTNPPYTRQEEMTLAFYDKDYKKYLMKSVEDIGDWNKRSSIYAYFLIRGAKLLGEGGRLGFIIENSWLNAEYGGPLKKWFLDNSTIEYVIESIVERWFEDAAIITDIIISEKKKRDNYVTRFIYFKKRLNELFGFPPSATDFVANQRYYEKIANTLSTVSKVTPANDYVISENDDLRVVAAKKYLMTSIEEKLGRWGILRGPKKYLDIIIKFLKEEKTGLTKLENVVDVKRGLTTNGNDLFYLPSKHWSFLEEAGDYLRLKGPGHKSLKISKRYLRRIIRPAHIEKSAFRVSSLKQAHREDYVLWVEDSSDVNDFGTDEYLKWMTGFIRQEHEENNRYPAIFDKFNMPKWTKLPDSSNGLFLFKNAAHRNYGIWLNALKDVQVDERLYLGSHKKTHENIDSRISFACFNSVFTYMGMELLGRTNLGEGALDIKVTDYKTLPIIDPAIIDQAFTGEKRKVLLKAVDEVLENKPANIELEGQKPTRLRMDTFLLSSLGFTKKDVYRFYEELQALADLRTSRATSIRKAKS